MKKRLLTSLLAIGILFTLVGCGSNSSSSTKNNKPDKGNCTSLECIKELKAENTVEDINKVMGFEGKLSDEKTKKYVWEIGKNDAITVTYYSGDTATIEATYNRDDLKDDKIDFSKYSEIQKLLKEGSTVTYDDFCDKVNGQGTLFYVSSSNIKYVWVNKDGEYLTASFSTSTGKCSFVTGRVKTTN